MAPTRSAQTPWTVPSLYQNKNCFTVMYRIVITTLRYLSSTVNDRKFLDAIDVYEIADIYLDCF